MKKVTISDIAKAAGVSIGTVSNVLNNKGNAKIDTIRKVEEIAKKMGYFPDESALSIRKKDSSTILLLVSDLEETTSPLITDLLHMLKLHDMELKVIEVDNSSDTTSIVNLVRSNKYKAIIYLSSITNKTLLDAIPPERLITLGHSTYEKQTNHISLNMEAYLENNKENSVTIIGEESIFGLTSMIKYRAPQFVIQTVKTNSEDLYRLILEDAPTHLMVFSSEVLERILTIYQLLKLELPIITYISNQKRINFGEKNIHTYYYSSNELALKIINMVTSKDFSINKLNSSIKIYSTTYQSLEIMKSPCDLNILMLENPFSNALQKLITNFSTLTGVNCKIDSLPFEELNKVLHSEKVHNYDLIRLDVSYFPWYGPRLFKNITDIQAIFDISQVMNDWRHYMYVDDCIYGLPVDPSIQMMLYRKDIFENPIIQKYYSSKYNRNLTPPKTYKELLEFCEFYTELDIPEKTTEYPLEMIGNSGVLIASEFLPYFFSEGGSFKYEENQISLDSDKFVSTLDTYRKLRNYVKLTNEEWWNTEISSFNHNETSIIIGYTNHLNQIRHVPYGYSSIPGSKPALGGGVFGICKDSQNTESAVLFFQWLYQYIIQEELASLGVCVPRTHLYKERDIFRKYPFLSYSSDNFSLGKRLQLLDEKKLINTIQLENLLGSTIKEGLNNGISSTQILLNVVNALNAHENMLIRDVSTVSD
ncbi:extracellular solute-binding protein [Paenibacillus lutimineralis]|uniref:Extracellular solute-binding protein n=1 Tax=Paenibacillus lutimineralis TaxID=2707005 RepID=A0A3Q9IA89_9BACL|nr:extracellular solute-binding protein [Paenibacillus lutimineralis]AZS16231.1 extracellular solute-binding protein [Paenibacillus lutimineralis]